MSARGGRLRRLLCDLGWHGSTYSDGAMFTRAPRCNYCQRWVDERLGAAVDAERRAWAEGWLR